MSELGQKQTFSLPCPRSAQPLKADNRSSHGHVGYGPLPDLCITANRARLDQLIGAGEHGLFGQSSFSKALDQQL
jgi:hypothetical protein